MDELFSDRNDAGRKLADQLQEYAGREDVIVLALPRGGVPVGFEVASALQAPLDIFMVRKLRAPGSDELAMGAVASGGLVLLNDEVVQTRRIERSAIAAAIAAESRELERRESLYRIRPLPPLAGQTILLVDDGLATGATMRAAVQALRQQQPAAIIVAAPVAAPRAFVQLRREADRVVSLKVPPHFYAVGNYYASFPPTGDREVTLLLARSRGLPPQTPDPVNWNAAS